MLSAFVIFPTLVLLSHKPFKMLRCLLFIIRAANKTENLIRLLAKLEFGVSIFLKKNVQQAEIDWKNGLALQLKKHSLEEKRHGDMLLALVDGNSRAKLEEQTGFFLSMIRESDNKELMKNPLKQNSKTKKVTWESAYYPGDKLTGNFLNLDGLSKRYLSLRIFFGGKKAEDFDWENKLAYMIVLERVNTDFYKAISRVYKGSKFGAIATKILEEEDSHILYLSNCLASITHDPQFVIDKWQGRLVCAYLGLTVDAIKSLWLS
jgi:hypothetical protein